MIRPILIVLSLYCAIGYWPTFRVGYDLLKYDLTHNRMLGSR